MYSLQMQCKAKTLQINEIHNVKSAIYMFSVLFYCQNAKMMPKSRSSGSLSYILNQSCNEIAIQTYGRLCPTHKIDVLLRPF